MCRLPPTHTPHSNPPFHTYPHLQPASMLYFIIFGVPMIVVGIYALALLSWSEL